MRSCLFFCLCVLIYCVSEGESFKVLKKLKDFIHGTTTTTTTTVIPTLSNYENHHEGEQPSSSEESKEVEGTGTTEKIRDENNSENDLGSVDPQSTASYSNSAVSSNNQTRNPTTPSNNGGNDLYPERPETITLPTDAAGNYDQSSYFEHADIQGILSTTLRNNDPESLSNGGVQSTPPSVGDSYNNLGGQDTTGAAGTELSSVESQPKTENQAEPTTQFQPGYDSKSNKSVTDSDDDPIVFPTENAEAERDFEVGDIRLQGYPESPSTSRSSKVHVPVPVDGGKTIVNTPNKNCGPGKKLDEFGNCRPVARR